MSSITSFVDNRQGRMYYQIPNLNNASYSPFWVDDDKECFACISEGKFVSPYYQLGPAVFPNCPYYNYVLPNVYPPSDPPMVPYSDYWYYPFERKGCQ